MFYPNIESLIFWSKSEEIGIVVKLCRGVMEYWNVEDPPLEGWNTGYGGMRSVFIWMAVIIKIYRTILRF